MDAQLDHFFKEHSIHYQIYHHPAIFHVHEGIGLKKEIPGLHCKTLFLKDERNHFYLLGMRATERLDTKKIRKQFGIKKIQFASPEELKHEIGLTPGSVSIFGIVHTHDERVTLVIEKKVYDAVAVGFHPNVNTATIVLDKKELEKFYNAVPTPKYVIEL
jgi:Ala-tRNA(Pro) deacylase